MDTLREVKRDGIMWHADLGNEVAAELMHQRTRPGEQEKGPPFTLIWIKTIGIFGTETVNPSDNCEENLSFLSLAVD